MQASKNFVRAFLDCVAPLYAVSHAQHNASDVKRLFQVLRSYSYFWNWLLVRLVREFSVSRRKMSERVENFNLALSLLS